jgi:hypothetical protein
VFPGAVGQKKGKKKEGTQSKKGKKESKQKERDRCTVQVENGNRFVSVKEFCATVSLGLEAF